MGELIGRSVRTFVRVLYVVLVVYLLLSVAVSLGLLTVDTEQIGAIETPEPLPDVPLLLEFPLDETPSVTAEDPRESTASGSLNSSDIALKIHAQTNTIRERHNRGSVAYDQEIESIGRRHSYDMADRGYFNHTSPEGAGPSDRFGSLFPRRCQGVGENLAYVTTPRPTTAEQVANRITRGWMNSSGHRKNLLTARWDVEGVGVYVTNDRVYASQEFCNEW